MKEDKLEQFIIENRDEFDMFEPSAELWDKIQPPAPKVVRLNWKTIVTRVAAVVVIFIASYFFHDMIQGDKNNGVATSEQHSENEGNNEVNVLIEAEMFYTSQINSAKEEIILLSGNDKGLLEDLNTDMVELDNVFAELKNDLKDNSDNEEVIEAMIQNYRIKLEILEEILIQLKKSQTNDNENSNSNEI